MCLSIDQLKFGGGQNLRTRRPVTSRLMRLPQDLDVAGGWPWLDAV